MSILIAYFAIAALIAVLIAVEDTSKSLGPSWRLMLVFGWPAVAIFAVCFAVLAIVLGLLGWLFGKELY